LKSSSASSVGATSICEAIVSIVAGAMCFGA
jgi:hypothetical protein